MQLESSVTLFDDNKVETRFAELQITADGITSEVGRKVGNDEVISRINQSAESIQIQANRVNIEGATIFSSGRLSQNSLNNAYDANGAATSSVNALKTDLSSSSGTTVINGGHITTGTIDASRANITNINASNIETGTLDADRIGAGSLEIGKLNSSAQATINSAGTKATNYITDIGNDGIYISPVDQSPEDGSEGNSIKIDGTGMEVYKGGVSVAKYGDSARVGKEDKARIEIASGSIDMYSGTSNIQKVAMFTQIGNAGGLQIYDNQLPSTPKIGTLFADSLSFGDNDDSGVFYWNSLRNDFHMSKPLSVAGHINPIGYVEDEYARYSTSIPNNTATQLAYVVLSEGTWMVVCGVRSPSNATGNRMANLSTVSGDSSQYDIIQRAASGQPTQLQFTVVVTPTTAKTYYLNACHDAGVTLSYPAGSEGHNNFIRAVRIA